MPGGQQALEAFLDDPNEDIRQTSLRSLSHLGSLSASRTIYEHGRNEAQDLDIAARLLYQAGMKPVLLAFQYHGPSDLKETVLRQIRHNTIYRLVTDAGIKTEGTLVFEAEPPNVQVVAKSNHYTKKVKGSCLAFDKQKQCREFHYVETNHLRYTVRNRVDWQPFLRLKNGAGKSLAQKRYALLAELVSSGVDFKPDPPLDGEVLSKALKRLREKIERMVFRTLRELRPSEPMFQVALTARAEP